MLDLCFDLLEGSELPESSFIGVTLLVGGTVISGDMITEVGYYKGIAEGLESNPSNSETNKAYAVGKGLKDAIDEITASKPQRDRIFLKDPVVWVSPNSAISFMGNFLALRTDSIDGFMWGKYGS